MLQAIIAAGRRGKICVEDSCVEPDNIWRLGEEVLRAGRKEWCGRRAGKGERAAGQMYQDGASSLLWYSGAARAGQFGIVSG